MMPSKRLSWRECRESNEHSKLFLKFVQCIWQEEKLVSSASRLHMSDKSSIIFRSFLNCEILRSRVILKDSHELIVVFCLEIVDRVSSIEIFRRHVLEVLERIHFVSCPDSVGTRGQPEVGLNTFSKTEHSASSVDECLFYFEVLIKCEFEEFVLHLSRVENIFWRLRHVQFVVEFFIGFGQCQDIVNRESELASFIVDVCVIDGERNFEWVFVFVKDDLLS